MHDYVKTLGTVIRKAREEQGLKNWELMSVPLLILKTSAGIPNSRFSIL